MIARPTKWRRQCELRNSESEHSFKLSIAAMKRFQAALPTDDKTASNAIGDAVREAHPRWCKENAPREACEDAVGWLCRLSLVDFTANVEVYLDEIEPRVRRVRSVASSEEASVSSIVKRAFFIRLALDGGTPPKKLAFSDLSDDLKALELFVRIRHRIAHADHSAGPSVQSCLADPAMTKAWSALATDIADSSTRVPQLPALAEDGVPVIAPDLTVYAGIIARKCITRIDDAFCMGLTEPEKLTLAVDELERRARFEKPDPIQLESWTRGTLVDDFGMARFAEPQLCEPGALAKELRYLGFWNLIPGSSADPDRMALQSP